MTAQLADVSMQPVMGQNARQAAELQLKALQAQLKSVQHKLEATVDYADASCCLWQYCMLSSITQS